MLKIDALSALLFIEALAILLILSVVLSAQLRKSKTLHRTVAHDLDRAIQELKELKGLRAEPSAAAAPAIVIRKEAAEDESLSRARDTIKRLGEEKEALEKKLSEMENALEEKNKQLDGLQAKLDNLEKEYLILYRQQQQQSGAGEPAAEAIS